LRDNYHIIPSNPNLYWLEIETEKINRERAREFIRAILSALDNSGAFPDYDVVLFDCPPSFTLLSYSVLTCCHLVLVPANPDFFAADGVGLLINGLQKRIRPYPLPKIGVFMNRVKTWRGPTNQAGRYMDKVKNTCAEAAERLNIDVSFFPQWIPDRVAIRDAITNRRTPPELESDFLGLWREIESKVPIWVMNS
jgi:chromosome partitioning protein